MWRLKVSPAKAPRIRCWAGSSSGSGSQVAADPPSRPISPGPSRCLPPIRRRCLLPRHDVASAQPAALPTVSRHLLKRARRAALLCGPFRQGHYWRHGQPRACRLSPRDQRASRPRFSPPSTDVISVTHESHRHNRPRMAHGLTGARAKGAPPSGRAASASSRGEGDGITPRGSFPVREIFYRADRIAKADDGAAIARDPERRWLVRCAG